MTRLLILAVLLSLPACSLIQAFPTVSSCEHVKYERNGSKATLEAECNV